MFEWVRETIAYKAWKRVLTIAGDLYLATEPPKINASHVRALLDTVQPGDIICRQYDYYFDSYFIPGNYSHSGIVVDEKTMVHAIAEGVGYIDVMDFVLHTDSFIVLRPSYKDEETKNKVIGYAKSQVGKSYDFLFDSLESNYFYCHELTVKSLNNGGFNIIREGNFYTADDLVKEIQAILKCN